jgi:hypothetical protein
MKIVSQEELKAYRAENMREIDMPDGTKRFVRMTPLLWDGLEFLKMVEGIGTPELAAYALEEMALQNVSFDRAFRGVIAYLVNRWT